MTSNLKTVKALPEGDFAPVECGLEIDFTITDPRDATIGEVEIVGRALHGLMGDELAICAGKHDEDGASPMVLLITEKVAIALSPHAARVFGGAMNPRGERGRVRKQLLIAAEIS